MREERNKSPHLPIHLRSPTTNPSTQRILTHTEQKRLERATEALGLGRSFQHSHYTSFLRLPPVPNAREGLTYKDLLCLEADKNFQLDRESYCNCSDAQGNSSQNHRMNRFLLILTLLPTKMNLGTSCFLVPNTTNNKQLPSPLSMHLMQSVVDDSFAMANRDHLLFPKTKGKINKGILYTCP